MASILLYDLAASTHNPRCWSYNPWKTRLALNFKKLEYQTTWLEYPDIAPTLSLHVPPNPPGAMPYTIPTLRFPDGAYIMDSKAIVQRLERDKPSPSLHIDSPILPEVEHLVSKIMTTLRGVWMPALHANLLNDRSKKHFVQVSEQKYQKPFDQVLQEIGGEEAWIEVLPSIHQLGEIIKKNEGPFVMGETPSYADFVIVGGLQFLKVIEEDFYNRVVKIHPAFGKLYRASSQWLERDDH
ncbi:hypothetical protein N431DRAFT_376340 [Stipitochalara longipes BDJ]|nr:hypothetical protein N431DRAFT_376340 [Stipitochalara longipes BDJ]